MGNHWNIELFITVYLKNRQIGTLCGFISAGTWLFEVTPIQNSDFDQVRLRPGLRSKKLPGITLQNKIDDIK